MRSRKGQPPRHGVIRLGGPNQMKVKHARAHLAEMTMHVNEVKDYGGHGTFSAEGGFSPGGASGADYQTTSVNDTADVDSAGSTGF